MHGNRVRLCTKFLTDRRMQTLYVSCLCCIECIWFRLRTRTSVLVCALQKPLPHVRWFGGVGCCAWEQCLVYSNQFSIANDTVHEHIHKTNHLYTSFGRRLVWRQRQFNIFYWFIPRSSLPDKNGGSIELTQTQTHLSTANKNALWQCLRMAFACVSWVSVIFDLFATDDVGWVEAAAECCRWQPRNKAPPIRVFIYSEPPTLECVWCASSLLFRVSRCTLCILDRKYNGTACAIWMALGYVNVVLGLFRPSLWNECCFDRKSKNVICPLRCVGSFVILIYIRKEDRDWESCLEHC